MCPSEELPWDNNLDTYINSRTLHCSGVEGTAMNDTACDRGNGAYACLMLEDVHLNGGNIH